MRYFSYNDYITDPSKDPIVVTLSEDEVIKKYYPYWYDRMCKKFGKEVVDANYTAEDCLTDWIITSWAWKVEE